MGGYDDGGGGEDDDHHADDAAGDGYGDDASDDEPTPAASSSSAAAAASSSSRGGKSGKVTKRQVKPRSKPSKRKPAAAAARPRDWQDDDEEGDDDEGLDAGASRTPGAPPARREPILSPGGTDTRRIRKSIHPSQAEVQEALALGMRRSGRRRWNPLEYWKGEHVEYRRGEKEEVFSGARAIKEGFLTPDTVKAKRSKRGRAATKGPKQGKAGSKRSKAAAAASAGGDAEEGGGSDGEEEDDGSVRYPPAMNPRDLPKAVQLTREGHENLQVGQREGHPAYNIGERHPTRWMSVAGAVAVTVVAALAVTAVTAAGAVTAVGVVSPAPCDCFLLAVCVRRAMGLKYQKLPSDPDTVTDDAATDVGMRSEARAAAAFDTPTFITGSVSVPPLCQKDEESTQHCLQIFCVVACQPKSLHVSVADKQFVLSPGDHFFVPHNTIYRLRNFSSTTGATIAFTVLKPALDDADEESAEE
jgi:mannose-6-phosphate isomerase-like protein (cupin superfamily)